MTFSTDEGRRTGFGPQFSPRAIVLSFDNLGEASELERGTWSSQAQLGHHASVTVALPRLLDELDALGLLATFFVEALNYELYPQALGEIAARGHELGVHGWRHEPWARLPAARERDLLLRAGRAFSSLGLQARAFRPPGGEPTAGTAALLRELGYRWWSPLGDTVRRQDGLTVIPFDWELVDAYHLMERFGELRVRRGESRVPLGQDVVAERLLADLTHGVGAQTVILHPFLMLDAGWWESARRVLALIAELGRGGHAWTVPGGKLAACLQDGGE
jgi:peptidoglycan/xylan/chitin deacetylase (PgdA/CDA1 family)